MKLTCKQCKRTIRSNSKRRIFLFLQDTPHGVREQYVCGKQCLRDYNAGEDLPEGESHDAGSCGAA